MRGMRRDKFDTPVRNPESDRAKIAADVEAYLAAGNKIEEVGSGISSPYLVNGVERHLVSSARRGGPRGRATRYGGER